MRGRRSFIVGGIGVDTEGSGPGTARRSCSEWGGAGSFWRRQEWRPGLGENRSSGLLRAVRTSSRGLFRSGRAATGKGASHLFRKLGTPSECMLFRTRGVSG